MKFRPVGAELFHADRRSEDGRTDRHEEANFSTAPTTLCFVSRTFIVLRTLHSHYRKQNLGSGLIILGCGISTVHQGRHPLLDISLGVVCVTIALKYPTSRKHSTTLRSSWPMLSHVTVWCMNCEFRSCWSISSCQETMTLTNLVTFAKLRKATVRLAMTVYPSVRLSVCACAWNSSSRTGRIFMKFCIWFQTLYCLTNAHRL